MGKIGVVSTIKRAYTDSRIETMDSALNRKGLTRIPGTGVFKFPYKEIDGKYRTGLDVEASYIKRILDDTERELEVKRVGELKEKLELALGVKLDARSQFYNYGLSKGASDQLHVQPVKLMDGDNVYNLEKAYQEMTFAWLSAHPTIADSLASWEAGDFPADTQFYIVDKQRESALLYKKKQIVNKAIVKLDAMIPTRRIKIARLLGLPVIDNTPEEFVYNEIDNVLKQTEFKKGKFKGLDPVRIFTQFADMKEDLLHIKDLVRQSLAHSIYRENPTGRIYEGDYEVAVDEQSLVKHLANKDNQEDLIILEDKLKGKKLASV